MSVKLLLPAVLAGLLAGCGTGTAAPQRATHDFIITAAKPGHLFVLDPRTAKVVSDFTIPDAHNYAGTIVPSPDGNVAYVLVDRATSIAGIDLRTGKEVFRANLSTPGERVQSMAFDVTPDGKELIVYELPTRFGIDAYKVEPPQFAIFSTAGGLYALPQRKFPAPRRVQAVLASKDGRSFYAVWPEVDHFDLKTGRLLDQRGLLDWGRPNHSTTDVSINSPASEPTGIYALPLYSTLTGPGLPADGVRATSLMTLDLHTGKLEYHDISRTAPNIFSTSISPDRHWAFGVFGALFKIDLEHWSIVGQVPVAHSYYMVNVSSDGRELYLGGNMCDIAIYDARSLREKADIKLPGCGDQALVSSRVIQR
ncbi:MAG TPA: quinohemoprotein amine dehydrogenase subunit beta [Steroidobacteraceae bacterium]|jgi:quinohemoprotein amine dehydrogenase beta subunit|nr:quinohemoprotein amine dehydrogenase subunit beta [Steroidobacteraceae bacterium]